MQKNNISLPHPPDNLLRGVLLFDESMSLHTSFRIGGPADIYFTPADVDDLRTALCWISEHGIPVLYKGAGTNLLVADAGIRGIVISLDNCLGAVHVKENDVIAGAGVSLNKLASQMAKKGKKGLTFAAGIPGNLGGALIMNAGAWQHSLDEVVVSVEMLDPFGQIVKVLKADMGLVYRSSNLPLGVVVSVKLELSPCNPELLLKEMKSYEEQRRQTQPLEFPSAGCIFRNIKEKKLAAGKLIEDAGLKGRSIGDAEVSEKHANFIINRGKAKASEVLALIVLVEETVYAQFNVELKREVKLAGQWGELLPSQKSQRV